MRFCRPVVSLCTLAVALLTAVTAGPVTAKPSTYTPVYPQAPAGPIPDRMTGDLRQGSTPVYVQSCASGWNVTLTWSAYAEVNVVFNVRGTKTADAVDFLVTKDMGPQYEFAFRETGSFAPDATVTKYYSHKMPWFKEAYGGSQCRVTAVHFTDGTEWRAPETFHAIDHPQIDSMGAPAGAMPVSLATTTDGALWALEPALGKIVRLDPGRGTERETVAISPATPARGLAASTDGGLWFLEPGRSAIGNVDAKHVYHQITLSCKCVPTAVAPRAAGGAWIVVNYAYLDRVDPDGTVTEIHLPAETVPFPAIAAPISLASASDGTLWLFTGQGRLQHLDADGKSLEATLMPLASLTTPYGRLVGDWIGWDSKGRLTLLAHGVSKVVRVVVNSDVTATPRFITQSAPARVGNWFTGVTVDSNDAIWYLDPQLNAVVRFDETSATPITLGITKTGENVAATGITTIGDSVWVSEAGRNDFLRITPAK